MDTIIFTVYDTKAEVYLPPFCVPTLGIATRAFTDCINSDTHTFGQHPSDYTLFQLGVFSDHDGQINTHAAKIIGNGIDYVDHDIPPLPGEIPDEQTNTPIQPDENGGHSA